MILDAIVAAKRRAHAARGAPSDGDAAHDLPPARPFAAALATPAGRATPHVIAEFKRRSPSAGAIRPGGDAAAVASDYARAGAAAISVLTDEEFFGGRLDDLRAARSGAPATPVLRKDFVLHDEEIREARAAGADAVLLIARVLPGRALEERLRCAIAVGLDALVEVRSEEECERALAAGARLIGVNHRDLDTLAIDLALSERLARLLPDGVVRVAESGLRTRADLVEMARRGYHAALVGEALLRAPSPGAALAELIAP